MGRLHVIFTFYLICLHILHNTSGSVKDRVLTNDEHGGQAWVSSNGVKVRILEPEAERSFVHLESVALTVEVRFLMGYECVFVCVCVCVRLIW